MKNKNWFISLILIALIFTLLDLLFHYFIEYLTIYQYPIFIPFISESSLFWYSIGKLLTTLIVGSMLLLFFKKTKINYNSKLLIFTTIITFLLQIRYILIKNVYYTMTWHLAVLALHWVLLYAASRLSLKRNEI